MQSTSDVALKWQLFADAVKEIVETFARRGETEEQAIDGGQIQQNQGDSVAHIVRSLLALITACYDCNPHTFTIP